MTNLAREFGLLVLILELMGTQLRKSERNSTTEVLKVVCDGIKDDWVNEGVRKLGPKRRGTM